MKKNARAKSLMLILSLVIMIMLLAGHLDLGVRQWELSQLKI